MVIPVEIESKTSIRSLTLYHSVTALGLYIIISVFVIAETFLKLLIVMCYCTFSIQETILKKINKCTKYKVC